MGFGFAIFAFILHDIITRITSMLGAGTLETNLELGAAILPTLIRRVSSTINHAMSLTEAKLASFSFSMRYCRI